MGQARRYSDPLKAKASSRAYYEKKSEHIKTYVKGRYKENPEEAKARIKQWKKDNSHRVVASNAKRAALKLKAIPKWADLKAIEEFYEDAKLLTEYLGVQFHVDHIVPLNSKLVCGLHWEGNLQILLGTHNLEKSNSFWPDMP